MSPSVLILGHAFGGRSDLPLPFWLFAYGAAAALIISFAALRLLWPASRLERPIEGRALPGPLQAAAGAAGVLLRVVGLLLFGVVFWAAVAGSDNSQTNVAPWIVFIAFWVGLTLLSALVGDLWRALSPFDTLAAIGQRLRGLAGRGAGEPRDLPDTGYWPAAVGLFGFVWLELVYFPESESPRTVAVAMALYTGAVLAGAAVWGRQWLREGEAFAAFFGLLARMAPFYQGADGRIRLRPPLAGLPGLVSRPGMSAVIFVALGSTSFDGLSRTRIWNDLTEGQSGGDFMLTSTLGLAWMVALVAILYVGSMRLAARIADRDSDTLVSAFVHSLVPIAFAYAVAHYFSALVFNGQNVLILASDPLGEGRNLFGTADWTINYDLVSTGTIAWVQAGGIVAGHVAGVLLAHDRAVAMFPPAVASQSQYPLLVAMVLYTVGGLALLLGA